MKTKNTPIITALVAGCALALPGFAAEKNAGPAKEDAPKEKPAPAVRVEKKETAPAPKADEKKPAPEQAGRKPAPPSAAPDRGNGRPGPGRPDHDRMREQMQGRMREVHELHQAGKHEEANRKMAEVRRDMEKMHAQFRGGDRDGDRQANRGPQQGPGRPPQAEGRGSQSPRPPMEENASRPEPPKPDENRQNSRPGPPSPEKVAEFREQMKNRMESIQKLRREGKHEEAWKQMAEFRHQFQQMRSNFGPGQHRGGPPMMAKRGDHSRPQNDRAGDEKKPGHGSQAPQARGPHGLRHEGGPGHARQFHHRRGGPPAGMMMGMRPPHYGPPAFYGGPRPGFFPPRFQARPFPGPGNFGMRPPQYGFARPGFGPHPGMGMRFPGGPAFHGKGKPGKPGFHRPGERSQGGPGHHRKGEGKDKGPEKKDGEKKADGETCENCQKDGKKEDS